MPLYALWLSFYPDPPAMSVVPEVTGMEASTIVLRCNATGVPLPRLEWYHNDQLRLQSQRYASSLELDLPNLKLSHAGHYMCRAQNVIGQKEATTILNVKGKLPFHQTEFSLNGTDNAAIILAGHSLCCLCQATITPDKNAFRWTHQSVCARKNSGLVYSLLPHFYSTEL